MRKILLMLFVLGFVVAASAQNSSRKAVSPRLPATEMLMEAPSSHGTIFDEDFTPEVYQTTANGRAVSIIQIGSSGNAYGFYANPRTYLWADPSVNSVVFTHRMTGGTELEGNSRIAYDVSTDGGATWTNNVKAYQPLTSGGGEYVEAAGRYPQGGILNPAGNTDPANAYYTYFICTLDNTNDTWGGYAYGSNKLNEVSPPNPSQANLSSNPGAGIYRLIPDAFTTAQTGMAYYVDGSQEYSAAATIYTGDMIFGKGEITDADTIAYEEQLIPFLFEMTQTADGGEGFNETKIAFSPDGMTGYIMVMTGVGTTPTEYIPYTSYHPVLMKTTDGGDTWGDPIHVALGGEAGIESLKYYWPDSIIEAVGTPPDYPPGFDRNEVYYNMGFNGDIVVDEMGNPHITGIITIANADGWYPYEGTMATWHVYSTDGGTTWDADALYNNRQQTATFGVSPNTVVMYNRPYVSSTYDGHFIFFSWLDTTVEDATDLAEPDIFVVGYDVEDKTYSEVEDVSYLTQAWFKSWWGSQSQYVFSELNEDETMYDCEIPFVYTQWTVPGNPLSEMKFYYMKGYTLSMPVGVPVVEALPNFSVSQNSPNPAADNTKILVNLNTSGNIQLTVNNMLGQVLYQEQASVSSLAHTFHLNVSNFDSGVYFYTIQMNGQSITKKMIVE